MPKSHVGESFIVALISGSEKVSGQQGEGEYQDFPLKIFCLTVPKIFVEESFTVAVMSGTGKVWIRRGEYQDFVSKNFVTVPKISVGGGGTQLQQEGVVTFCKLSRHKIHFVHKDVKTFSTKWLHQK